MTLHTLHFSGIGSSTPVQTIPRITTFSLLTWCSRRLEDSAGVRLPSFRELWEIRRKQRGEGGLKKAVAELWRRAAPLTDYPLRSSGGTILTPAEILDEVRSIQEADKSVLFDARVTSLDELPILCAMRIGDL